MALLSWLSYKTLGRKSLANKFDTPQNSKKTRKMKKKEFPGLEKSWKIEKDEKVPEKILESCKIHINLELSIEINDHERHERLWQFSDSQIIVLENLNFDLEKSWKSTEKRHTKNCGNPDFFLRHPVLLTQFTCKIISNGFLFCVLRKQCHYF